MKRQTDLTQFFTSSTKIRSSAKEFGVKQESGSEPRDLPSSRRVQEGSLAKPVAVPQFGKAEEEKSKVKRRNVCIEDESEENGSESEFSFKQEEEVKTRRPASQTRKGKDNKDRIRMKSGSWDLPLFLRPENIRDINKRRPDDPEYDSTSVFVPEDILNKMTAAARQYWKIKQHHRDKVVLQKLGTFYEIFNEDAILCHKLLDLNWTGPLHVGFPEWCVEKYASMLVNYGYRVIVAEQMETPKEMMKRLKQSKGQKKEKTIQREVCRVFTKGLFIDHNPQNYEAKYVLSVYTDHTRTVGIVILDAAALNIKIGQFDDDGFW
eukprot:TRINITY_DN1641_c0_g1_i10.p1 TRINITY_DN1641_c0_g1~~TRINITY_DN1641_c0_g1_i10.p1  ORF type:complete len:321 (-),score=90.13 TRINITY_DN1641_c0_g1_i10:398-1360(-)